MWPSTLCGSPSISRTLPVPIPALSAFQPVIDVSLSGATDSEGLADSLAADPDVEGAAVVSSLRSFDSRIASRLRVSNNRFCVSMSSFSNKSRRSLSCARELDVAARKITAAIQNRVSIFCEVNGRGDWIRTSGSVPPLASLAPAATAKARLLQGGRAPLRSLLRFPPQRPTPTRTSLVRIVRPHAKGKGYRDR